MKKETWKNSQGVQITCYEWPCENEPKFVLYLSHGYAEHAGRYRKLVNHINSMKGIVRAHDHFAHGNSGPYDTTDQKRYQLDDFDQTADDLSECLNITKQKLQGLPIFLYGHSMGGLLSLMAVLGSNETPADFLILESPAIKIHPSLGSWWMKLAMKGLNAFVPNLKVGKADFSILTRNKNVIDDLKNDPLCANGGATATFALKFMQAQKNVQSKLDEVKLNTFVVTGAKDLVCCPTGSELASKKIPKNDFKIYPDAYHQLHCENEDVMKEFFEDLSKWIEEKLRIKNWRDNLKSEPE